MAECLRKLNCWVAIPYWSGQPFGGIQRQLNEDGTYSRNPLLVGSTFRSISRALGNAGSLVSRNPLFVGSTFRSRCHPRRRHRPCFSRNPLFVGSTFRSPPEQWVKGGVCLVAIPY